jgi:hypothetical protein
MFMVMQKARGRSLYCPLNVAAAAHSGMSRSLLLLVLYQELVNDVDLFGKEKGGCALHVS